MHRSEAEGIVSCAVCGAAVDPSSRAYSAAPEVALCWDCAVRRGGRYDEVQDRWLQAPDVEDLALEKD